MRVDTGADQTIVDAELVKPREHLGSHMTLTMAVGSTILSPLARVCINFVNYQIYHVVAVAAEAPLLQKSVCNQSPDSHRISRGKG